MLYNLQELCNPGRFYEPVYFVEGEKCADLLNNYNFLATTSGACTNWQDEFKEHFNNRTVICLSDNDNEGFKNIREVVKSIHPYAEKIKALYFPSTPEKGDVDDFFYMSGDGEGDSDVALEAFKALIAKTPYLTAVNIESDLVRVLPLEKALKYQFMTDTEIQNFVNPEFQVEDIISKGSFTVLYAPPKKYKSFISLSIAASVQCGRHWCGYQTKKGQVVYVVGEGGISEWKTRIQACKDNFAKCDIKEIEKWQWLFGRPLLDTADKGELIKSLCTLSNPPDLIVLDTYSRTILGSQNADEVAGAYVRAVDEIREKFNCTIFVIHHTPISDRTRLRGSSTLTGAADMLIRVETKGKGFGSACLICEDSRCSDPFEEVSLNLEKLILGYNEEGHEISSLKVSLGSEKIHIKTRKSKQSSIIIKNAEEILEILRIDTCEIGVCSGDLQTRSGLKGGTWDRVLKHCVENELVTSKKVGRKWFYRIVEDEKE